MFKKIKGLVSKNILYKTLFFSGILGIIGLLVLGIFAYRVAKSDMKEFSQDAIKKINRYAVEHINWEIERYNLVNSTNSDSVSEQEIIPKVRKFLEENNQANFANEGKDGYTYILDGEGNLISHPDSQGSNVSNYKYIKEMLNKKEGEILYSWEGKRKYVAYEYIPKLDWVVATGYYVEEMVAPINRLRTKMIFLGIIAIALMGVGAIFLTRHITGPINKLAEAMEEAQAGDLTPRVEFTERKDELGQLGTSFNKMLGQIVSLIQDTVETSNEVSRVSDKLSEISNEASALSEQASYTTEEMAEGADKQSSQLEEISDIMGEISSITEETAIQAENAQDKAINTLNKAQIGNEAVEKVINKMEKIQGTVDESAEVIYKLGEKSSRIGEIIEIISNIAKQTDLLALNAAIEAARAGEQGQGFAVVADEVRKLAEESREATEQVADIITEIQGETKEAVKAVEEGTKEVTEGEELADDAGEALKNIMEFMEGTAEVIEEISSGAEEQSANTQQVAASISDVASVSQQTAAGAQQNLALIQEQADVVGEVSDLANVLNNKAKELDCKINRFNLAGEGQRQDTCENFSEEESIEG